MFILKIDKSFTEYFPLILLLKKTIYTIKTSNNSDTMFILPFDIHDRYDYDTQP